MDFTFNATPGDPNANSYSTVEFANDHLAGELYASEWAVLGSSGADLLQKQQALVKATRRLERFSYCGEVPESAQRLKHPRLGLESDSGVYYSSEAVADPFREACAELALHYLRNDPSKLVEDGLRQFKHLRIAGAIELEMRDVLPDTEDVPAHVLSLIEPWLSETPGAVRLIRG
jgi:hypothetical protein